MRWLRKSQAVPPTARGSDVKAAEKDRNPTVHDSPALSEIFTTLDPERPVRVLDLGPATPVNLEYYSAFASGVRIAHLLRDDDPAELEALDTGAFVSILDRLSPIEEDPFELILVWDLLNYLVNEQPTVLSHHLAAVATHGTQIHAMIVTAETMPSKPSRFELLDAGRLDYLPTTAQRTAAPDPPAAQVERWLNPFRITRSFLLRHGVREFLGVLD